MKKLLALTTIALFLTVNTLFSQGLDYDMWSIVETVDDFGDKTGNTVASYFSKGKFSNSATTGEEMIFKIVDYGLNEDGEGQAQIDFYEYNKTQAKLAYDTKQGSFKVKLSDDSLMTFKCYALKGGGLAVWDEDYKTLFDLINNGKSEKIRFVVNQSAFSEYGSSKYSGHFHTKAANQIK